ncbi:hypothetical protein GCM10023335_13110 [Streptomyces siamensis]|uniref:SPW_0924 family protein n=2 Tax=Streptomyces TaxID=1883 RepID=A0ABP9IJF3_9ACTN
MSRLALPDGAGVGSDRGATRPVAARVRVGTTSDREADPAMSRLLAAALTVVAAALLAVGAALGIVALLDATPDQPNTPLITYEHAGQER